MTIPRLLPRLLTLLSTLLLLAACVSTPRITTDTDPQADFSRYRTFAFYAPLAAEGEGYSTPASGLMRTAARREMEARGYVYDESQPDLLVNINAYVEERVDEFYAPSMYYGAYYGYRGAYWGGPYWMDYPHTYRYSEGTLNVDLVDARRRHLVWEGIAVGRVSNMRPSDRAARIHAAIAEIFMQYPHRAGGG